MQCHKLLLQETIGFVKRLLINVVGFMLLDASQTSCAAVSSLTGTPSLLITLGCVLSCLPIGDPWYFFLIKKVKHQNSVAIFPAFNYSHKKYASFQNLLLKSNWISTLPLVEHGLGKDFLFGKKKSNKVEAVLVILWTLHHPLWDTGAESNFLKKID